MSGRSELSPTEFRMIVAGFHAALAELRSHLPRTAFKMFEPIPAMQTSVPREAWWDQIDALLDSLTRRCLSKRFSHIGKRDNLEPIGGAISRHEPVLRKVPQYAFPDENAWEQHVLRSDADPVSGQKTYPDRMRKMQEQALEIKVFEEVPKKDDFPKGRGLIPLLEHVAVYPQVATRTAATINADGLNAPGWSPKAEALIVDNLQTNKLVSEGGRASYQPKGCILLPIVSHDRRLIGSALVVYNRAFDKSDWKKRKMDSICEEWRLVLDTTFAPLLANLNTAALSALDTFFLGRVRELRHRIATAEESEPKDDEPPVPTQDCFVLNKIALYEALQTKLLSATPFSLVFFDLDGFKGINEKIGHQFADVLLFHIAKKLVRGEDAPFRPQIGRWLFRFGGDEFVGIVPSDVDKTDLSGQVSKAIQAAKVAYDADDRYNKGHKLKDDKHDQKISCSVGWVSSSDVNRLFKISKKPQGKREIHKDIAEKLGLDAAKQSVYGDMRDPLVLLELADTHTQERVKDFGKGGWLEFEERIKLPFKGRSAGIYLFEWLKAINWFQEHVDDETLMEYERILKSDIKFLPPPRTAPPREDP